MLPCAELCPTIEGDGLASMDREGRQTINQAFHHRFGLSVWVLERDRKPTDTFHQRRDVFVVI
jgi:hypothetical protein